MEEMDLYQVAKLGGWFFHLSNLILLMWVLNNNKNPTGGLKKERDEEDLAKESVIWLPWILE